jgi:uncharacterized protein YdaU (DUF1376 family)
MTVVSSPPHAPQFFKGESMRRFMHYYQFHIGDYRASTAHLSNEEDLAYRRLIDMYYDLEQPISLETQWVARRLRLDTEVVARVLQDMFVHTENGWTHTRCDTEIAHYRQIAEKNKLNGIKGGRPKKPTGIPLATDRQPTVKATNNQEPITNNHKPVKNTAPMPSGINADIWNDWIVLRKSKKAAVTETAIKGIEREAAKAGMTLEQVLVTCCERGWAGFKAEWVQDKRISKAQQQQDRMLNVALEWLQESK